MNVTELIERLRKWHNDTGAPSYRYAADALEALEKRMAEEKLAHERWRDEWQKSQQKLAAAELEIERQQRNEAGHLNVICEQQRKLAEAEKEIERLREQVQRLSTLVDTERSLHDSRLRDAERNENAAAVQVDRIESRLAAAERELKRYAWLVDHGERCFGSLWREASVGDIDAAMKEGK